MRFTRSVLRRGPAVLGATVAVAAATAVAPLPLHAQPAEPNSTPPKSAATQSPHATLDGVAPGPHTVTLITGDKVTVTDTGNGLNVVTKVARRADGSSPPVSQQTDQNGVYAIPADAEWAVATGIVDRELFNVEYLVENGYADKEAAQVPVIVQYPKSRSAASVASAAQALPASTETANLSSIHSAGLSVPKAQAGAFWKSLNATAPGARSKAVATTLGAGVSRVWLDRKVTADLAESVPLIGAPEAWAAGHDGTGVTVAVLDTGIDTTHPDLAGKVVASKSFVPDVDSVQDGHGHGTHVASTIVGSGAASGGKYKGVAPGAQLMVGKVLDDTGGGPSSVIIEGMQWAASSGADIVSMSLGGGPTDGSDPLSQAVNDLTAQTGTLFVVAAGNEGPAERTVAAPGAADAALTVAATDKSDGLADFSSQGPRLADSALKPDIAAPGVDIVAARAAGTGLGTPVDDHYTSLNGTSMATPHVAGAAAILAQSHPGWTPAQLKAALMSTSTDAGHTVYQQGAGRVDVARADRQGVYATTPNADFGSVPDGATAQTRQITYANLTDQPVTLTLAATLRRSNGDSVDGAIAADQSVTVPAGGAAIAAVTVDPNALDQGTYSGAVVATDASGAVRLRTPVGIVREPPTHAVTIHILNRAGDPAFQLASELVGAPIFIDLLGTKGALFQPPMSLVGPGTIEALVPEGVYSISDDFIWIDANYRANYAMLLNPQVTVDDDVEITLDARTATDVRFDAPQPAEPDPFGGVTLAFERTSSAPNALPVTLAASMASYYRQFVTPTQPVTLGRFAFQPVYSLTAPMLTMSARTPAPTSLHPVLDYSAQGVPFPAGSHNLPLVDGRSGRPEQLAGLDLRGRLVLLDDDHEDGNDCHVNVDVLQRVKDAGATGVVVFPAGELGACNVFTKVPLMAVGDDTTQSPISYATVPPAEGRNLRDQLSRGPLTVTVNSTPVSPFVYSLTPTEERQVPKSLHYGFKNNELAEFDITLHSATPRVFTFWLRAEKVGVTNMPGFGAPRPRVGPATFRQYVGPLSPDVRYQRGYNLDGFGPVWSTFQVLDRPTRTVEHYNADPITPGSVQMSAKARALAPPEQKFPGLRSGFCSVCRQGDVLWANVSQTRGLGGDAGIQLDTVTHLYNADGQEIPLEFPLQATLPKAEASYRLTAETATTSAEWRFRSATATTNTTPSGVWCRGSHPSWGGSTAPCRPEPLVYVATDLGPSLSADNTAQAGGKHTFDVTAYHSMSTAPMPKIAGMKVWTSTDDGKHWSAATVKGGKDGNFSVTADYPAYSDTTGTVSLKVEASDVDGNTVTQTTAQAFGLRDRRSAAQTRAE